MIWVYLVFAGRYVSGDVQDAFAVHPRFSTCWCFYWGPPHNSVNYYWYYYYYKLLLSYYIPHCFGSISRAEHMVKRYSLEFHESDVDFLMSCFTSSKMQTVANFLKEYFYDLSDRELHDAFLAWNSRASVQPHRVWCHCWRHLHLWFGCLSGQLQTMSS